MDFFALLEEIAAQRGAEFLPLPPDDPPDEEYLEYEERLATEARLEHEATGRVYGIGIRGGWSFR